MADLFLIFAEYGDDSDEPKSIGVAITLAAAQDSAKEFLDKHLCDGDPPPGNTFVWDEIHGVDAFGNPRNGWEAKGLTYRWQGAVGDILFRITQVPVPEKTETETDMSDDYSDDDGGGCNTDNLPSIRQFDLMMLIGKISLIVGEAPSSTHRSRREIGWFVPLSGPFDDLDCIAGQRIVLNWDEDEIMGELVIEGEEPSALMLSVLGTFAWNGIEYEISTSPARRAWSERQDWSLPEPEGDEDQDAANWRRWVRVSGGIFCRPPKGTPLREWFDPWMEKENAEAKLFRQAR